MELGHHLHQALGAHLALRHRVVARFDGHHGQDQQRIHRVLIAGAICRRDETGHRLLGDAVALGDELGHETLLALARRFCRRLNRARGDARGLHGVPVQAWNSLDGGLVPQRQQKNPRQGSQPEHGEQGLGRLVSANGGGVKHQRRSVHVHLRLVATRD